MKSIMQNEKKCYITGSTYNLEEHHIFGGTANRKLSEKYGLKVWLSARLHTQANGAVHENKEFMTQLKQDGQRAFMKHYPDLKFLEIFGRNYL